MPNKSVGQKAEKIFVRDKGRCYYCQQKVVLERHLKHPNVLRYRRSRGLFLAFTINGKDKRMRMGNIDHVMPIINGGTDNYNNLVLSCATCNCQRHATGHVTTFEEYMNTFEEWCKCGSFVQPGSKECKRCRDRRKNAKRLLCSCGNQKNANRPYCNRCAKTPIEYYI